MSHLKWRLGAEGVEDPGVQGAVEEGGNVLVGVWTGAGLGDGTLCSGRTALEAVEGFSRELEAMGCEGHLLGSGTAGPCSTVQLPPWPSLLAPSWLFEAETTRACAEAGC